MNQQADRNRKEVEEYRVGDKVLIRTKDFSRELNKMLGIKTKLLTAYHLETNRQIERINQELEQYLRMYIDHR